MRRSVLVVMLAVVMLCATAPALATTVVNDNGHATVIEGYWGFGDPDGFVSGYASAWAMNGRSTTVSVYQDEGAWVLCDDMGTEDPEDDYWGFVGRYFFGEGSGTMQMGRRYATGHAEAVLDVYGAEVDDCAGEYAEFVLEDVSVTIHVAADSPLMTEKGTSIFHIPGELNDRYHFSTAYRTGSAMVMVGELEVEAEGALGSTSWHYHFNGK